MDKQTNGHQAIAYTVLYVSTKQATGGKNNEIQRRQKITKNGYMNHSALKAADWCMPFAGGS